MIGILLTCDNENFDVALDLKRTLHQQYGFIVTVHVEDDANADEEIDATIEEATVLLVFDLGESSISAWITIDGINIADSDYEQRAFPEAIDFESFAEGIEVLQEILYTDFGLDSNLVKRLTEMKSLFWALLISLLHGQIVGLSVGGTFSIHARNTGLRQESSFSSTMAVLRLRGGESEAEIPADEPVSVEETRHSGVATLPAFSAIATLFGSMGKFYSSQLDLRPIITKSWTAGLIFALSDYLAQRIEKSTEESSFDTKRMIFSIMIGALYFAPAAHYWYEAIFRFLPGKGLVSTLQKALLGQAVFGPSFTCIFFASSLMQNGTFSLANWGAKIRSDLPGAWLAGSAFWPLVDIISYSMIPVRMIPLFVNVCSLIWTIYLSIVSNKDSGK